MGGDRITALAYDGAPRSITEAEAVAIAEAEYQYNGRKMYSAGSDGGMHYRMEAYSEGAARGGTEEKRRHLVRRIMRGECDYTIFYDHARDKFYCG